MGGLPVGSQFLGSKKVLTNILKMLGVGDLFLP
jgi:hypothetical protein